MTEYFLPDEDDARVLRILIEREKKRNHGKGAILEQDVVPTAQEVYIARIPSGGIDGISLPATGTGDISSINSAECSIYQVIDGELIDMEFTEEVFNLSPAKLYSGYILIKQDKYGVWLANQKRPDIYGQYTTNVSYGSSGILYLWNNGALTLPSRYEEDVKFDFLGKAGDVIEAWTLVEARWWDDLNDGAGAYRVSNANCDPELTTGTGTA